MCDPWHEAAEAIENMAGVITSAQESGVITEMARSAFQERFAVLVDSVARLNDGGDAESLLQSVVYNSSIFYRILTGDVEREDVERAFVLSISLVEVLLLKGLLERETDDTDG